MCNCKGENHSDWKTPYCNNICDCVDWTNAEEWVKHIHENFVALRDALTYDSLETLENSPAVLCVLGTCKKCGKQICVGSELKDVNTFDALMERLFRDVFCCDKNDESKTEDTVLQLLHEEDRERGSDWIYLNRDKPENDQFSGINPKFNERVRHIPGYTLELMKNIYTGLGPDDSDLAMIAKLSSSDVDWLRYQHNIRVKREVEIAEKISAYSDMWNRFAVETRIFGDALYIAEAERPRHTQNQWVVSDDGLIRKFEISNAVYKMTITVETPSVTDAEQIGAVRWKFEVNALPKATVRLGRRVIKKGKKTRIRSEEDAYAYVDTRKKVFAKYFVQEFPPVPKSLIEYFSVDGVFLPEYTLEQSE